MSHRGICLSAAYALVLTLAGCGGEDVREDDIPLPPPATLTPQEHLETRRFTTDQPRVLEQIGAHHAYAKGLTGKGVRIGIEDTIVDYTQRAEFGNRVKLRDRDGALLAYDRPFGDDFLSDPSICEMDPSCDVWVGDSEGGDEATNAWVQQIVREDGWPERDDSVFILDEFWSASDAVERLFRWYEVPTPYGTPGNHGTIVASVAAGKNLGVAPEATIIPIATNLTGDQDKDWFAGQILRSFVTGLPQADRNAFDDDLAQALRQNYARFDIINRSYGIPLFDPDVIAADLNTEITWLSTNLPKSLAEVYQTNTPDAEKTILVYAAGNDSQPYSGIGADYPFYVPALRRYSLSVVATDPGTGLIADYSNRCGPLPTSWNAADHGPHYCLAAPGTVRGLVPDVNSPGAGQATPGLQGTSYAAPIVAGGLALMMEHFRGTRGNTAIVKRMFDTAERTGVYADFEIYGAGHLDLEAALSPVGSLTAGQSKHALSQTSLTLPSAFGSMRERIESLELATFDDHEFPFWVPVSGVMSTRGVERSPIPELEPPKWGEAPGAGLGELGLSWTPVTAPYPGESNPQRTWVAGFGPGSASLARTPDEEAWGYGLSFSDGEYLGGRSSGAFGSSLRSGMIWTSRSARSELGRGWSVEATGTLALAGPQYEEDALFEASPSVMSAASVRVGSRRTGITLEQPLRAESGTGTFRLETGELVNGKRRYKEHRVPLAPDAREVRAALRHEREAGGGRIALEIVGALNADHTPGRSWSGVGVAYGKRW